MQKDRFLVWGTGFSASNLMCQLSNSGYDQIVDIIGFVDNKKTDGKCTFRDKPVYSPQEILDVEYDYIDIRSVYEKEIKIQIIEQLKLPESKVKDVFYKLKEALIQKYESNPEPEIAETIQKIKMKSRLEVYNYQPQDNIEKKRQAFYDCSCDLYYVNLEGKRLYLKRNHPLSERNGQKYASCFWDEQDSASPHRYLQDEIEIKDGDIVVDAGACEASLSLENIEKISKLYLIEASADWMEALQKTFAPYAEKVVFCQKYLCDINDETHITLDYLLQQEKQINFLKMDIEGSEVAACMHGKEILRNSKAIRCAICSYHRHGDELKIKEILKECGFEVSVSKGYMVFLLDKAMITAPELRRGIVRGIK